MEEQQFNIIYLAFILGFFVFVACVYYLIKVFIKYVVKCQHKELNSFLVCKKCGKQLEL